MQLLALTVVEFGMVDRYLCRAFADGLGYFIDGTSPSWHGVGWIG